MARIERSVVELYGLTWAASQNPVDREVFMIRNGGRWKVQGVEVGLGMFHHFRRLQELLWPDDDHHRWSDLMLQIILENRITAVLGPKDCGKTHCALAKYGLTDYFCFPRETLILMSSTDIRGLELRVWGDLKDLYNRAREVWPEAPGNIVDSAHGIFTDAPSELGDARDMRRGLICIPCLESNGQWKGLEKYTGIKQKRRRLLGDECQFMQPPYLTTLANLNKGDFKGVFVGNPIGENDPLDKLSEPVEGWDSMPEIIVTTTWENRMGGTTINLVGTDSPGISEPEKYPYLINQKDINYIVNYWGVESAEYWNQAVGVRKPGISLRRVVSRDMARKFNAQDSVVWSGKPLVNLYAIDASYGGDRCVGGDAAFGTDIRGIQTLAFGVPKIIPIRMYPKTVPDDQRVLPEDQIAEFVKEDCETKTIPSANVFHDATGRGSLGTAFARIWTAQTNPIDFGGSATSRPVSNDLWIYDEDERKRRLKRCDEHYSKFVTELWYSVRYIIEGNQCRQLPDESLDELCAREWGRVKGDKIEVEKKEDTKKRIGRSPDFGDWAAIIVEGARRLGFQIARLENPIINKQESTWKKDFLERKARLRRSYELTYS